MRLGIVDVGSNTVHLMVVDVEPGVAAQTAAERRWESTVLAGLDKRGRIGDGAQRDLIETLAEVGSLMAELGVGQSLMFATSALREASNAEEVLSRIKSETGACLQALDGDQEAALTFLAARRWFGMSVGSLLLVDIGGGSLELAFGHDAAPDHVVSLPLGAARLTRDLQLADPPGAKQVAALQERVAAEVAQSLAAFRAEAIDTAVGTSKTLRSLARVAGAAPSNEGPRVRRVLTREDAAALVEKLAGMPSAGRAKLPGVSQRRAPQLLAGAVVAATTMNLLGIEELRICPWALREGIMLTQRDATAAVPSWAEASGG